MSARSSIFASMATALALSACAPMAPTAPSLLALPGQGKTLEQFTADDIACRGYAQGRQPADTMAVAEDLQRRYDVAYVQCMYAKGHKVPVPGVFAGKPSGEPPPPPPPPTMIPPPAPPAPPASETPQPEVAPPQNPG